MPNGDAKHNGREPAERVRELEQQPVLGARPAPKPGRVRRRQVDRVTPTLKDRRAGPTYGTLDAGADELGRPGSSHAHRDPDPDPDPDPTPTRPRCRRRRSASHPPRHRLPAWWARRASTRHPASQFDDTSHTNNHDLGCYTRCRPARRSAPVRRRQRQATVADSALGRLTTDSTVQAPVKPTALAQRAARSWSRSSGLSSGTRFTRATPIGKVTGQRFSGRRTSTARRRLADAQHVDAPRSAVGRCFRVYVNGAPALIARERHGSHHDLEQPAPDRWQHHLVRSSSRLGSTTFATTPAALTGA